MKSQFKLLLLTLGIFICSCKEDKPVLNYKFTDHPSILKCQSVNVTLYQEAFYSFEQDLIKYYSPDNPNFALVYSRFVSEAMGQRLNLAEMVSDHSKNVFEALKNEDNLWDYNGNTVQLNYSSAIVNCIGKHIKNKELRETYNALVSTNNMNLRLFGSVLKSKIGSVKDDKHLTTYLALDLYYGKLFNADLSATKTDATNTTKREEIDPHAGHNH